MKLFTTTAFALLIATISGQPTTPAPDADAPPTDGPLDLQLNVAMRLKNLAYQQPYRNLCLAMTRIQFESPNEDPAEIKEWGWGDKDFERLIWTNGEPASEGLSSLAQGGDCTELMAEIKEKRPNAVFPDIGEMETAMLERNQWINFTIPITVTKEERKENKNDIGSFFPFVFMSFVSQLANTNDGFVGVQNLPLRISMLPNIPTMRYMPLVGHDAGVEENTQLCRDMDAPGCEGTSENANAQPGEGVVHVHRGFHTVQLSPEDIDEEFLDEDNYDFRSPNGDILVLTSWSRADDEEEA